MYSIDYGTISRIDQRVYILFISHLVITIIAGYNITNNDKWQKFCILLGICNLLIRTKNHYRHNLCRYAHKYAMYTHSMHSPGHPCYYHWEMLNNSLNMLMTIDILQVMNRRFLLSGTENILSGQVLIHFVQDICLQP